MKFRGQTKLPAFGIGPNRVKEMLVQRLVSDLFRPIVPLRTCGGDWAMRLRFIRGMHVRLGISTRSKFGHQRDSRLSITGYNTE